VIFAANCEVSAMIAGCGTTTLGGAAGCYFASLRCNCAVIVFDLYV